MQNNDIVIDMSEAESPCVQNCSLDEQRICRGCFRHLDEIMSWPDANDATRRDILERVAARRGLNDALMLAQDSLPA